MRCHPLGLIHDEGGAHEHVPATGQHQHEGPEGTAPARLGVEPHAEAPVVLLALLARGRVVLQHRYLAGEDLIREGDAHVAPKGGLAHGQSLLISQPLVHRGQGVGGEPRRDGVVVAIAGSEARRGQLRDHELREPGPGQSRPGFAGHGRAAGDKPGGLGGGDVLADSFRVKAQALGDKDLGPAGVPVLEDLDDVDHDERSPCQIGLLPSG